MGAVAQPLYKQIAPCGPCLAGRRASHAGSFPGREALPWPVHGSCDREHPRVLETRHSMSWQPAGTTATHRMGDLGAVITFTLYTQMCCPLPPAGGMLGGWDAKAHVARVEQKLLLQNHLPEQTRRPRTVPFARSR